MFMPVPRIHNHEVSLPKFPWFCPERSRSLYKDVLKYRYELTPYIYSTAIQSSIDGGPIVRPLGYHNISDEITNGINDEFYLGDNIIMVPVVTYGASERLVYLPKGKWINNWTKEEYDGKQFILVPCPLYQITGLPMFIKKRFHYSKTRFYINSLGKCTRHRTTPEVL